MDDLKNEIIKLLENNNQSGFFTEEIADLIKADVEEVFDVLKLNVEFVYDKKCESFTGWRLKKYI